MTRFYTTDHPCRMKLDFSQKMRAPDLRRFKFITDREKPPGGGTLAFPDRPELYQVLAEREPKPDE